MPADVAVYILRGNQRSQKLGDALHLGATSAGMSVKARFDNEYSRPDTRVAAFYGFQKNHPRIMQDYVAAGRKVVFADLGYWGRHEGGRWEGYHKIAVNGRHPGAYLRRGRSPDRFRRFGLKVKPWRRKGSHIVLAGMSGKAAESWGFAPNAWERAAVSELRQHTDRPIIYRPKPSWKEAKPIAGCDYSPPEEPLQHMLRDAWAVVTHHSNVAVDGLVEGVPCFAVDGVAAQMGSQDLTRIETPDYPDGREDWLSDLAWCQWNMYEIRSGKMWRHLMKEDLL